MALQLFLLAGAMSIILPYIGSLLISPLVWVYDKKFVIGLAIWSYVNLVANVFLLNSEIHILPAFQLDLYVTMLFAMFVGWIVSHVTVDTVSSFLVKRLLKKYAPDIFHQLP